MSIIEFPLNLPLHNVMTSLSKQIKSTLLSSQYIPMLVEKMEDAEKEEKDRFSYFQDIEIIYYFIHQEKDMNASKNRKETTKKSYFNEILTFCQTLVTHAEEFEIRGDVVAKKESLLKAIEPWNVRRYGEYLRCAPLGKRKGEPYKPASLAKKTTIIKSFLSFLYESHYIEKPLHHEVKRSSVRSEDRPNRDLTLVEMEQILSFYRTRSHIVNYTILLLLATTGLRIREVTSAKMKDIHYLEGHYWLTVVGKRNKERQAYISPMLFRSITEFRKNRGFQTEIGTGDESPLLLTIRGNAYNPNQLSNQVTKMVQDTALPFLAHRENPITPHTFRHLFAITAAARGVEITKIQRTLGHDSIYTTQIYLEKYLKRQDNAALSFADDLR
ncbi:tyrosine-type recombinase/integrase [Ectobacillus sp. sgz5001026]|uniref:tyrosine-type recombinase/integrase n=1 Tax=Ectobacillus sp. sgz5001026 TaxID=3242473 RepID=UPI0036D2B621